MKRIALLVTLCTLTASTAHAQGRLSYEYFDCSPQYKLFSVSWSGPWSQSGPRSLENSPTNLGPWSWVLREIQEGGCWAPAQNLRWYRVRDCGEMGCMPDSNTIWLPQQRCNGQPNFRSGAGELP
jgi:hypothetical protein